MGRWAALRSEVEVGVGDFLPLKMDGLGRELTQLCAFCCRSGKAPTAIAPTPKPRTNKASQLVPDFRGAGWGGAGAG